MTSTTDKDAPQVLESRMVSSPGPLSEKDKESIREFQTKMDLEVDGVVGHQTWCALYAVMAGLSGEVQNLREQLKGCMTNYDDPNFGP